MVKRNKDASAPEEISPVPEEISPALKEVADVSETVIQLEEKVKALQSENEQLKQALATSEGEVQALRSTEAAIQVSVAQAEVNRLYSALGVDPTQPIEAIRDRLHALGVPGY